MYSILNAIASCTLTVYVNVYEFHSRLKTPIMRNAASILSSSEKCTRGSKKFILMYIGAVG